MERGISIMVVTVQPSQITAMLPNVLTYLLRQTSWLIMVCGWLVLEWLSARVTVVVVCVCMCIRSFLPPRIRISPNIGTNGFTATQKKTFIIMCFFG